MGKARRGVLFPSLGVEIPGACCTQGVSSMDSWKACRAIVVAWDFWRMEDVRITEQLKMKGCSMRGGADLTVEKEEADLGVAHIEPAIGFLIKWSN